MPDPQDVTVLPSQRTFAFFQLMRPDLQQGDYGLPEGQGTAQLCITVVIAWPIKCQQN